jgi:hypothetical protein
MSLEKINITATLDDIEFTEGENGSKRAQFTVIQMGWSQNKRYYDTRNLQEISNLINNSGGTMMFFDHRGDRTQRSVTDWAATLKNSTVVEGKTKGAVDFTEKGMWLYEEVKKHPHLVQISINAKGKLHLGMAEGKEGDIVDSVNVLESVDFVTKASAGGEGNRILAGCDLTEEDTEDYSVPSLVDKMQKESGFYNLMRAFIMATSECLRDHEKSADDKKKTIKKHIKDLGMLVDSIDFDVAYPMYASATEAFCNVKDVEQKSTVSEGDTNMDVKEIKTPAELKEHNEGVYTAIVTLARTGLVDPAELEAAKKQGAELHTQKEALEAEKTALVAKNAENEKKLHEMAIDSLLASLVVKDKAPLREQLLNVPYDAAKKIVEAMQSQLEGSLPAKKADAPATEAKGKAPVDTGAFLSQLN